MLNTNGKHARQTTAVRTRIVAVIMVRRDPAAFIPTNVTTNVQTEGEEEETEIDVREAEEVVGGQTMVDNMVDPPMIAVVVGDITRETRIIPKGVTVVVVIVVVAATSRRTFSTSNSNSSNKDTPVMLQHHSTGDVENLNCFILQECFST